MAPSSKAPSRTVETHVAITIDVAPVVRAVAVLVAIILYGPDALALIAG